MNDPAAELTGYQKISRIGDRKSVAKLRRIESEKRLKYLYLLNNQEVVLKNKLL